MKGDCCSPLNCPGYASGWCEYDPATDTIYPADENACMVLRNEKENEESV